MRQDTKTHLHRTRKKGLIAYYFCEYRENKAKFDTGSKAIGKQTKEAGIAPRVLLSKDGKSGRKNQFIEGKACKTIIHCRDCAYSDFFIFSQHSINTWFVDWDNFWKPFSKTIKSCHQIFITRSNCRAGLWDEFHQSC